MRFIGLLIPMTVIGAVAFMSCKTAQPQPATETDGVVGETLTDLATIGIDNPCRQYSRVDFDQNICADLSAGKPQRGTNTGVCRYYCDAKNGCISPFGSDGDLTAAIQRIQRFTVNPANGTLAAMKLSPHALTFLQKFVPYVQLQLEGWRPMLTKLQQVGSTANGITAALCAANMVYATSNVILEIQRYAASIARGETGDFDDVAGSQVTAKMMCIAMSVVSSCGTNVGVPPPVVATAAAGSAGCAITAAAASAIMCQQARDCCLATVTAATGVATTQVDEAGNESRTCCSCTRQTWHNRSWRSDVLIDSKPWGSVVTDTDRPVPECEGREGKYFYSAAPDAEGRWVYYMYTGCEKRRVQGDTCWISE